MLKQVCIIQALVLCSYYALSNNLPSEAKIDSIVIIKKARVMDVYQKGRLLKDYKVALGHDPIGPKHFKGDMRTPEGIYFINGKNPNSTCHKNLGISYPSTKDRTFAQLRNRSPGGDIKIHGLPRGQENVGAAHIKTDWTWGCIAVTNEEIDEIFEHVSIGTIVNILP